MWPCLSPPSNTASHSYRSHSYRTRSPTSRSRSSTHTPPPPLPPPQVQKLLARHKAELSALSHESAEDVRRHLEAQAAQHEGALKLLKERLAKVVGGGARGGCGVCGSDRDK